MDLFRSVEPKHSPRSAYIANGEVMRIAEAAGDAAQASAPKSPLLLSGGRGWFEDPPVDKTEWIFQIRMGVDFAEKLFDCG